MADTVGIIVNGQLAYEQALRDGEDLEALFLYVCQKGGIRRIQKRFAPWGSFAPKSRRTYGVTSVAVLRFLPWGRCVLIWGLMSC